jgi:hypothetical protein
MAGKARFAMTLADASADIGWNILEASQGRDDRLFAKTLADLKKLLERLDMVSGYLGQREPAQPAPSAVAAPVKKLLVSCSHDHITEVVSIIETCTSKVKTALDKAGRGDDFPPAAALERLKIGVADLTGALSQANI